MIGKTFAIALLLNDATAVQMHKRDLATLLQTEQDIDFDESHQFVSQHQNYQENFIQHEFMAAQKEKESATQLKQVAMKNMQHANAQVAEANRRMQDANGHINHVNSFYQKKQEIKGDSYMQHFKQTPFFNQYKKEYLQEYQENQEFGKSEQSLTQIKQQISMLSGSYDKLNSIIKS
jgi:hypothetical protein